MLALHRSGVIDRSRWAETRAGDFREAVADIVGGRLRLRLGTIGTRDDTVKHLGIRSLGRVVDLLSPVEIGFEVDWNNQANGCYLQASVFLCPTETNGTASAEPDWLAFEYIGVPPGRNARAQISRRQAGQLRLLYTEGWPDKQRTGRSIGKQKVILRLGPQSIELIENGRSLWGPSPHDLPYPSAYLYVEVSSHSNYAPREILFDGIYVRPVQSARRSTGSEPGLALAWVPPAVLTSRRGILPRVGKAAGSRFHRAIRE